MKCPFCDKIPPNIYHEYEYVCKPCGVAWSREWGYESRPSPDRPWKEIPECCLIVKEERAVC